VICLSFDTDRMDEEAMAEFLDTVDLPGTATFFCTQQYDCLASTNHELAPHAVLGAGGDWDAELQSMRAAFPSATGWRSHSCVFSHLLAEQLWKLGYRYVSVHDDLGHPRPEPRRHAWGIWQLPVYYMDNLDFSTGRFWAGDHTPFSRSIIESALDGDGLYVFGFHPIHIVLNSPSADEYFVRRKRFADGQPARDAAFEGRGTRTFYEELCAAMRSRDAGSVAMRDALAHYDSEPMPRPCPE
jgi:hypothetical protein